MQMWLAVQDDMSRMYNKSFLKTGMLDGRCLMAMAEAWFCAKLTIFVFIRMDVLDHCPARKSNDNSVLVSWQGHPDSDFKCLVFNDLHDATYPNKVPRAFGGKTAPQHHGTILAYRLFAGRNHTYILIYRWHLMVVLETWWPRDATFL